MVRVKWNNNGQVKHIKLVNDSLSIFQQLGAAIIKKNDVLEVQQYLCTLENIGLLPAGNSSFQSKEFFNLEFFLVN